MTKIILAILTLAIALASAESDIVRRQWTLPELTPVIEAYEKPNDPDPFATGDEFKPIESFNKEQLVLWLKTNGVSFPPGSSANYNEGTLVVDNTPHNLELVDHLLSNKFPVQISLQLLKRFLAETKNKPIDELPAIISRYPRQTLGPLQGILAQIADLDLQLASKPDESLKRIINKRRDRILKMLPGGLEATRTYFDSMIKIMAQ
ncbi:MAG: hypothetical protein P1U90_19145 [Akkermansiaceae bacterium]|nr:hypothetical protein [Akkermansiaceae bacterium]